jgi:disulfide bond formation protein DsbB
MNHRSVGLLTLLAALAALGVAYWSQDFLHLVPCPLCLWERWPYRVVAALGVLAILVRPPTGRVVLALAIPVLLAGIAVAFLHLGVEQHWWRSPLPECNGFFDPNAPLPAVPARPCDSPTFLIPFLPVSMAAMDLCYAAAFALAILSYVIRKPRRFR